MTHPSSATILAELGARCPDWRTRYGNAHEAVRAVDHPPLTDLYAQWLRTDAGVRYMAYRVKWEADAKRQRVERDKTLDREHSRDEVNERREIRMFDLEHLGAAYNFIDNGMAEA